MTKSKIFHTQLQAPSSSLQMSQHISQFNILRKWRKLKTTRKRTKRITIFLLLNIRLYEEFSVRSTCLCISLCHILWEYFSFPLLTTSWPGGDTRLGDRWNLVGWVGVALVNIKYQIFVFSSTSTVVKMINILIFQYWILLGGKFSQW